MPKNLDELLKGILEESGTSVKSTEVVEVVKDGNTESSLPNSPKPVKLIEIPPTGLEDFG